ncbi:MAG: NADPH-dependent F420 reductase [Bacteroidota bacterium]
MNIAFIGIGNVGFAIANHLQKQGHNITVAHNNPQSESVKAALSKNSHFTIKPVQMAVNDADIIFLSTPFQSNEAALKGIVFNGKTLVDCTNPVVAGISHGLNSVKSGSEVVQELAPDAKVVKAFTIYGFENFSACSFPKYNVKPVMLMAGDHADAKNQLSVLIEDMGFYPKDCGALNQALHLEHMTLLWVKMVRLNPHQPNFVWGYMEQ